MKAISCIALLFVVGCAANHALSGPPDAGPPDGPAPAPAPTPTSTRALPLVLVADFDLPGRSTRFDYQDIDKKLGHLVVTHMNDGVVLIVDLKTGAVLQQIPNIPTPRGVVVADDVGLIFVTSTGTSGRLVLIDEVSLTETSRVPTGTAPDGVGWDPVDKIVGVSDQGDGALSLIANAGSGTRTQVPLGNETGNVIFDATRGWFWITVVGPAAPDRLVAVDPKTAQIAATIGLPGCDGAHGLRLHPDAKSAFIACEGNDTLARVDLDGAHTIATAPSGAGPDVLSIDPGLGWLYVAAESGDLTVFDLNQPGVALLGHDSPGNNSHSVAVDPATHRVFFPLMKGPNGTPVLRILSPSGG
jgi:DNA-binding beta-propeller fold protein YncE